MFQNHFRAVSEPSLHSKIMDIESVREYCLSQKATTESFPFGDDSLVIKVMDTPQEISDYLIDWFAKNQHLLKED